MTKQNKVVPIVDEQPRAKDIAPQEPQYYFQQDFGSGGTDSSKPTSQETSNLLANWNPII